MGKPQLREGLDDRVRMVQPRAEDADLHHRHRGGTEGAGDGWIELKALKFTPLLAATTGLHATNCKARVASLSSERGLHARGGEVVAADPLAVEVGTRAHPLHVIHGFLERRDAAESLDVALSCVVGGECDALVAETVDEIAKVTCSGRHDVRRLESIFYSP